MTRATVLALIEFDPIVWLHIGPVRISPHGIGTAVGFLAGVWLFAPVARKHGVDDQLLNRIAFRALIGALVGARLAYAINHWGDYSDDPLSVLAVWEGGISLFGGLAGGVLGGVSAIRRQRLPFWALMDAAAPAIALGILIGRIGDVVVGDHLGKPTDFALGFRCTGADTASPCDAPIGQGVHMPALYDLVSITVLLGLLLVLRRRQRWDGFIVTVFAAWYGTGRFLEDFFRIDDNVALGLSGSQLTALTLALTAWLWLLLAHRTPRRSPLRPAPEPGTAEPATADVDAAEAAIADTASPPDRGAR
jgi:phosphatidylglycerol:prolipoprotein diacylglycerol transferase